MTVMQQVLQVAKDELGYLEKASKSSLYDKTKNAGLNNFTKYWEEVSPDLQGEAWCACFVTWTLQQVVGKDNAKKLLKHYPYISCQAISRLHNLNSIPKVGDIVIFYRKGRFAHTGWVIDVQDDEFTTIEGNTSGASGIIRNGGGVCKKKYYNSKLDGTKFITLNWSLVEPKKDKQITETLVNEYGSITADSLNIRQEPTTQCAIIGKHIRGDVVYLTAKTSNGWYKVLYPFGTGYLHGNYVTILQNEEKVAPPEQDNFSELIKNYFSTLDQELPSEWSQESRNYVESSGIIKGDDNGNKKYKAFVNREEMAQILYNIFSKKV